MPGFHKLSLTAISKIDGERPHLSSVILSLSKDCCTGNCYQVNMLYPSDLFLQGKPLNIANAGCRRGFDNINLTAIEIDSAFNITTISI